MTFILDGKILPLDTSFEHDGTSYPANWLRLATPEMREAIGITERPDYPRPDDRFYWVSENPDGTWDATPKDLAGLKVTWSAQMKQTAWTLLQPSDWLVIRKQENDTPIPADWASYREAVRTTCELAITNLEAAADIEDFITAVTTVGWPQDPNAPVDQQPTQL